MECYSYKGPVYIFDRCVADRWEGETMASSEKKAKSNLAYQYKKNHNLSVRSRVSLPGVLIKKVGTRMRILWVFEATNLLGFKEGFVGAFAQTYEEAENLVKKHAYEYPVELKYLYNEVDMRFIGGKAKEQLSDAHYKMAEKILIAKTVSELEPVVIF